MSIFKTLLTIVFIQALMGNSKQIIRIIAKTTVGMGILFIALLAWIAFGPVGLLVVSLLFYGIAKLWKTNTRPSDQQNPTEQATSMDNGSAEQRPMFEQR